MLISVPILTRNHLVYLGGDDELLWSKVVTSVP